VLTQAGSGSQLKPCVCGTGGTPKSSNPFLGKWDYCGTLDGGGHQDGRAVGHKFYTPGHHHEANNMTMMGNAEGMMEGSRVGVWG
jgi:hypothetical protein